MMGRDERTAAGYERRGKKDGEKSGKSPDFNSLKTDSDPRIRSIPTRTR
jgi:hypothetical protein